ncbi:LD-carboxypeptidase [Nanoarchaeota archaeon]
MEKIIADKLKPGDTIGIVSPSNPSNEHKQKFLKDAIKVLEEKFKLKVKIGKSYTLKDKYGVSAGSPQERAEDINGMFKNPEIKMIWCAQGGHTANQVLDYLDFELIKNNPKIFSGLSDITVLINALNSMTGLVTFHGPDPKVGEENSYFTSEYSQDQFKERFIGGKIGDVKKNLDTDSKFKSNWKCIREGKAKGRIIGSHLGCFLKLAGTKYFPDVDGAILLLEACTIDIRKALFQLTQLKQMGVFDKISGIVIGYVLGFEKNKLLDKDGQRVYFEDLVLDVTKDYDFPILKIQEFGHQCPNTFLPIGCMAEIDASEKKFSIIEECVK